jgi:hypothetical protein
MSTALIEYTGDKASPGYWMSFRRRLRPAGHALPLPPSRGRCKTPSSHRGMKRTSYTASALVLTFLSGAPVPGREGHDFRRLQSGPGKAGPGV